MPTLIQTAHGKVTGLWGAALIRGADGKMHALKLGDMVSRGDVILTTQDGIVQLTLDPEPGQRVVELPPEGEIEITPAAGLTGGEGGDLQPGLRVARIVESLTPASAIQAAAERSAVPERPPRPSSRWSATPTRPRPRAAPPVSKIPPCRSACAAPTATAS